MTVCDVAEIAVVRTMDLVFHCFARAYTRREDEGQYLRNVPVSVICELREAKVVGKGRRRGKRVGVGEGMGDEGIVAEGKDMSKSMVADVGTWSSRVSSWSSVAV